MNTSRQLLLAGGIANLGVGLMHFVMPLDLAVHPEFASLSPAWHNFLLLLVLAIGLCGSAFGGLDIFVARAADIPLRVVGVISLTQAVLWFGRLLVELALPVTIPLFGIAQPTVLVLVLASLLCAIFLAAYVTSRR